MRMLPRRTTVIIVAAVAVLALVVAACSSGGDDLPSGAPKQFNRVLEAYKVLKDRHVDRQSLDPDVLADAAVRGMVATLDDPFTTYFPPQRFQSALDDIQGVFQGIGAQVTLLNGLVTVVAALPDSPAEKAGVQSGDVILAVDGQAVEGLSLNDVVARIRGPKGSTVKVRFRRAATGNEVDLSIVRDDIRNVTVLADPVADGIARVRVTQFVANTNDDLVRVLNDLKGQNVKGIVIDLRNNPGGLLRVVVDAASNFLKDGLVLFEVDANGKRMDWPVQGGGVAADIPLAVLVNKGSASGSEVFAGAMQDQKRGPVIGTQTFGKGVVNLPVGLMDGSGLYVTIARWFTPDGRQIGKTGIAPDITVELTDQDVEAGRDPQLARAVEALRQRIGTGSAAALLHVMRYA